MIGKINKGVLRRMSFYIIVLSSLKLILENHENPTINNYLGIIMEVSNENGLWTIDLCCPENGIISFKSPGFTQTSYGQERLSDSQHLTVDQRKN